LSDCDAIVIGSGPNGLVAANLLSDAGWSVIVLEAHDRPGGAVRTDELTLPGYRHDLFSAFYPLAAASPVIPKLNLEQHGLRWRNAPAALAHPLPDGSCATIWRDLDRTAESLESFAVGDGAAWRSLFELWRRVGPSLVNALFTPFPPIRAGARLLRALGGMDDMVEFLRFSVLPARRAADERFGGAGGGLLLAGNALHADLTPESAAGGLYGWLLASLGQHVGWPVPEGGAGELTAAMIRRLETNAGVVRCGSEVAKIVVSEGRAVGVRTSTGEELTASHAVLADVGAPALYLRLLEEQHVPRQLQKTMRQFEYDTSTVKVDWALSAPVPWEAPDAREAGTVHVTDSIDELSRHANQLARGLIPDEPFLVFGQHAMTDPTRFPEGGETAWAYTHVPQDIRGDASGDLTGDWSERETDEFVERMEARVERLAPGFKDLILGRHVFTPPSMERINANLVGGAINGGTAQIHQQVIFRPPASLGRPDTPIKGLFLASASAHPGGGVHGAPGANAARAALRSTSNARIGTLRRLLRFPVPIGGNDEGSPPTGSTSNLRQSASSKSSPTRTATGTGS
jgi:phytoene dehydrogenase-like protein